MTMDPIRITIFHTNDMHGNLEGIARLSSLQKRLSQGERTSDRLTFFFDAGDAADRKISIVSSTKGAAFGPILNVMGYDAQALGNDLNLTYGPQCVVPYSSRLNFPLLAANLRNGDGPLLPGVSEYALFDLPGNQKLAVIGLTPQAGDIYPLFGIEMLDPSSRLLKLIQEMRESGVRLVVLLSHSGLREDRAFAETIPGLDLIIGGHSHSLLEHGEEVNGVLIAQAGEQAGYLGRVDLDYDPTAGQVLRRQASLIEVPGGEIPDPAVLAAIKTADQEAELINNRPVAFLQDPLELDYFEECSIGNFTADALRFRMDAELAIVTTGLFHSGLPAGKVTLGQLRKACFSTANPALTNISGDQILEALEAGRNPENYEFLFTALRGAPIGIPQISGLKVWFDPQAETGQRIRRVEVGGEPLDRQRTYRVAHTDIETFRYGCIHLRPGQKTDFEMPTILNEVMLDAMQSVEIVVSPTSGRWVNIQNED